MPCKQMGLAEHCTHTHTDSGSHAASAVAISAILAKWGNAKRGSLEGIAGGRRTARRVSAVPFYVRLIHMHGTHPFTFLLAMAGETQRHLLEEEGMQTDSSILPALLGRSIHPVHGLQIQRGTATHTASIYPASYTTITRQRQMTREAAACSTLTVVEARCYAVC